RGYEYFVEGCDGEKSLYEGIHGARLLRYGYTVLRGRIYGFSDEPRPDTSSEYPLRILRSRAHDVHRNEIAWKAETGCRGLYSECSGKNRTVSAIRKILARMSADRPEEPTFDRKL